MMADTCLSALAVGLVLTSAAWFGRRELFIVDVVGWSMHPTYNSGDRLLAYRTSRVRAGHIVVADLPAERLRLVKRVAAGPGDVIPDRFLTVVAAEPGQTVPPEALLILGDNSNSFDSMHFGYCPSDALVGRVIGRIHASPSKGYTKEPSRML